MQDNEINAAIELFQIIRNDAALSNISFSRAPARRRKIIPDHAEKIGISYGMTGLEVRKALSTMLTEQWGEISVDEAIRDEIEIKRTLAR